MKTLGATLLALVSLAGLAAPWIAPHASGQQFDDHLFAPPMRPHIIDDQGAWHAPFVYPVVLTDRLLQRYEEDRSKPAALRWLSEGKLVSVGAESAGPLLLLGADSFGRDLFTRLVYGARVSLGLAAVATLASLVIGLIVGAAAGYAGGTADEVLMRVSELVLVLPAIYLVLALRAVLPLVLAPATVFALLTGILALVGWPYVARGVRGIVASEKEREYAQAAISLGASPVRVLVRHLLPATGGFLAVQATLLVPAFILAEATLSFVGLGFPDPTPSWGAMLHEAANVSALVDFPWVLAPAAAIFIVVLSLNLIVQSAGTTAPVGSLERSAFGAVSTYAAGPRNNRG